MNGKGLIFGLLAAAGIYLVVKSQSAYAGLDGYIKNLNAATTLDAVEKIYGTASRDSNLTGSDWNAFVNAYQKRKTELGGFVND